MSLGACSTSAWHARSERQKDGPPKPQPKSVVAFREWLEPLWWWKERWFAEVRYQRHLTVIIVFFILRASVAFHALTA